MSSENPNHAGAPEVAPFDLQPRTRIVFGPGKVQQSGELASGLGMNRVLLVTDRGIVKAGHADRVQASLAGSGLSVTIFADVEENPTTLCVQRCLEAARSAGVDGLVALGGGSSMDAAKGCNFLFTNPGEMKDYWGWGKAQKPMLPFIAIPTTAGTGSECQSYALISDAVTHQKMACGDPKAAAKVALLDPELTLSQPPSVTACTGIDALAHAIESAVTKKRNPVSMMYSVEAFRLIASNLERIFRKPGDLEARAKVQLGAAWAGAAIENSMLGAAHSCANPLTARYGIAHGQAVGIMLPNVIRTNQRDASASEIYRRLLMVSGWPDSNKDALPGGDMLAIRIECLLQAAGMPRKLKDLNVERSAITEMASEAAGQWTAQFNPVPVEVADFQKLYLTTF